MSDGVIAIIAAIVGGIITLLAVRIQNEHTLKVEEQKRIWQKDDEEEALSRIVTNKRLDQIESHTSDYAKELLEEIVRWRHFFYSDFIHIHLTEPNDEIEKLVHVSNSCKELRRYKKLENIAIINSVDDDELNGFYVDMMQLENEIFSLQMQEGTSMHKVIDNIEPRLERKEEWIKLEKRLQSILTGIKRRIDYLKSK